MKHLYKYLAVAGLAAAALLLASSFVKGQAPAGGDRLVVYGDTVYFYGVGKPRNCILNSQFKKGEPVGFRMTVMSPAGSSAIAPRSL